MPHTTGTFFHNEVFCTGLCKPERTPKRLSRIRYASSVAQWMFMKNWLTIALFGICLCRPPAFAEDCARTPTDTNNRETNPTSRVGKGVPDGTMYDALPPMIPIAR